MVLNRVIMGMLMVMKGSCGAELGDYGYADGYEGHASGSYG